MTRIIGGVAGGRRLAVPPAGTRPTSDRVREALFSMLEARDLIAGARVLDLYAGSGALGLEALSRGAASAVLVERDPRACAVLARNVATVGLAGATVRRGAVATVLAGRPDPMDLVLADPPYADPVDPVLGALGPWLADGAVVVLERDRRSPPPAWPDALVPAAPRRYGETSLHVAARVPDGPGVVPDRAGDAGPTTEAPGRPGREPPQAS